MSNTVTAVPGTAVDEAIQQLLKIQPERCTIVHCRHFTEYPTAVRIWHSTFLVQDNGQRKKLIKAFNISLVPHWTEHLIMRDFIRFTLVFEGLGRDCTSFRLLEDIPEPGGFFSNEITRNTTDVYQAEVFSIA